MTARGFLFCALSPIHRTQVSHSLFVMAHSTWHIQYISSSLTIISFFAALLIAFGSIDNVSAQIEAQPWYETLPAVAMDYKIHLDAGKEDCYYQYVQPGATLYVSFQVSLVHSHIICSRSPNTLEIRISHFTFSYLISCL